MTSAADDIVAARPIFPSEAFEQMRLAILETQCAASALACDLDVSSFLLMGTTDSRHYADLAPRGILRFSPYTLSETRGDLARIHGVNERIRVTEYLRGIQTYARIFERLLTRHADDAGDAPPEF